MKSVLRCQNSPQSVGFSIIYLLIASKKSVAAFGPLKRPKQAFSSLSISQCFDSQSRKATDGGKRGDVIRWSVFDLPPRFALNSFPILFAQFRSYPSFIRLFVSLRGYFRSDLEKVGFVSSICNTLKRLIANTIFNPTTGNPLFAILKLAFVISLLYVVYRVIKRAINRV